MFPKTYFPKRFLAARYFPPIVSSGPAPSTGTPDVCYVACARDTEFTSVNRGASFSGAARDAQYTATGGKG